MSVSGTKTIKISCPAIEEVISVKVIPLEELRQFKNKLIQHVNDNETIDMSEYYLNIVNTFINGSATLLKRIKKYVKENYSEEIDDVYESMVRTLYETVVSIYPELMLEYILASINNDILETDMADYLDALYNSFIEEAEDLSESSPAKRRKRKTNTKKSEKIISSIEDIQKIQKRFENRVIGQPQAIEIVMKYIKLAATNLVNNPSLLFIGPTGTGKTLMAKVLGEEYSGNFYKINCGEYSQAHEYAKLIGSPPGYVGSTEKSILETKAEKSNKWVLLFDEIEKAHHKLFDFMLALLDDGMVTASNGIDLDFSESIIILTSNEGIKDLNVGTASVGFNKEMKTYKGSKESLQESVKRRFSPEFLGRIDDTVYFNPLTHDDLLKIAKLELQDLPIKKNKNLLDYIIKKGVSDEYGARFLSKFITREIKSIIADAILSGKIPDKGNLYTFKIVEDKLELDKVKDYGS